MPNSIFKGAGLFILLAVFFVLYSSYFVVSETEQYIITRFGKPVRQPVTTAGLAFKVPVIEKAIRLEKRVMEWDGYPNQIPTRDKKYIVVDATARWKIVDPLKFIETVRTERGAQSRLDDILDSAVRESVSRHNLWEAVRSTNRILETLRDQLKDSSEIGEERLELEKIEVGRQKIEHMILEHAKPTIAEYGIELIDIRIKRLNYEASVQQKVFERMISERKRIAEKLRSEGAGKKAEIEGKTNKELNGIESEAYKQAQEIKGKADGEAANIYAAAYQRDAAFFDFTRTLSAYKESLDKKVTLFLSSSGEFLSKLNQ